MKKAWLWLGVGALCVTIFMLLHEKRTASDLKMPTAQTPASRYGLRSIFPKNLIVNAANIPLRTGTSPTKTAASAQKIGFLFVGNIGDYGFTYAQNQGRLAVMEQLGLECPAIADVPQDEKCLAAFEELIAQGCGMIFATSQSLFEYAKQMAVKHPEVKFLVCSGLEVRENLGAYFGRIYQIRYLNGIAAGLRTKTNHIGFVAAHPTSDVIRALDSFALGVKSVNKEAVVDLHWSNSWYNPARERELALKLIDSGCDVIATHQDSVASQVAAEDRGVWCIGINSPMQFCAPNAYLTGASWNWGPYMVGQVRDLLEGKWRAADYWGGLDDDIVRMDVLSPNVAPGTGSAVAKVHRGIRNGWEIFTGPLYDNRKVLRVAEGKILNDEEKRSIDWLADNIVGEITPVENNK